MIVAASCIAGPSAPSGSMPDRIHFSPDHRGGTFDPPSNRTDASETPESRALLWIDDEIRPNDAIVRLFALEGLRVDCAEFGDTGLAMAETGEYVGVILDLRLPDMSGLAVLERLVRRKSTPPILILTAYPDFDAAVQAMRLGAWDYKSKTILMSDEWVEVVHSLAEHGDRTRKGIVSSVSREAPIAARLLALSDELRRPHTKGRAAKDPAVERDRVVSRLGEILANSQIHAIQLLVCAKALRLAIQAQRDQIVSVLEETSRLLDESARREPLIVSWRVQATISRLEEAGRGVAQSREEDLAREFGVDRAHLGRLLRSETGFTFREWRWAFLLRPALPLLATSREQIAQIAYRCGYATAAQFDHDFQRMFRMSPTEYRRLLQRRTT